MKNSYLFKKKNAEENDCEVDSFFENAEKYLHRSLCTHVGKKAYSQFECFRRSLTNEFLFVVRRLTSHQLPKD